MRDVEKGSTGDALSLEGTRRRAMMAAGCAGPWAEPPLLSVIIAARDAAETIGATLASVRAQRYRHWEAIVVDDGSNDSTAAVVSAQAAVEPRLRLLSGKGGNAAAARNLAIGHARGQFIAPLDADDLWHPDKLTCQLARLSKGGTRLGMVYSWSRILDADGRCTDRAIAICCDGDAYASLVLHNIVGNGSAALIRKDCLEAVGGFDESLPGCQDLSLYLAIAERFEVAAVPYFHVGYRQRSSSISSRIEAMSDAYCHVMDQARARHPELPRSLFRWSAGHFYFHLGRRSLAQGRRRMALRMFCRTLMHDPAYVFGLPYASRAANLAKRMACGHAAAAVATNLFPSPGLETTVEPPATWMQRYRRTVAATTACRSRDGATLTAAAPRT